MRFIRLTLIGFEKPVVHFLNIEKLICISSEASDQKEMAYLKFFFDSIEGVQFAFGGYCFHDLARAFLSEIGQEYNDFVNLILYKCIEDIK